MSESSDSRSPRPSEPSRREQPGHLLVGPPEGLRRTLASVSIAAAVVAQVAIPLSYYFGGEPADERFAWRMFSSASQRSCDVTLEVSDPSFDDERWRPLPLRGLIGNEWMESVVLGQPRVVAGVLERACLGSGADAARFGQHCRAMSGDARPPSWRSMDCRRGAMRSRGTLP